MSVTVAVSQVAVATKRRTWRFEVDSPSGESPVVTVFRETQQVDASGAVITGQSIQSTVPLALALTPAVLAALPAQFQSAPAMISAFGDWLEANPGGVAKS